MCGILFEHELPSTDNTCFWPLGASSGRLTKVNLITETQYKNASLQNHAVPNHSYVTSVILLLQTHGEDYTVQHNYVTVSGEPVKTVTDTFSSTTLC